jgi:sulfur relay (sulfurtransferase) DsrC/TusE family protein
MTSIEAVQTDAEGYLSNRDDWSEELAMELAKDDLVPQVKDVLTAMDFMDMSEGAQIIFT